MPNFLRSCHCQGYPPEGVAPRRRVSRADLIALMLRDRAVARFVVAPAGYGRTALACEYADIVFRFRHVLWVSCARPCFLRDLDAGTLVEGIAATDAEAALVVWEDVPRLSPERAEAFAALIDVLLERHVEVVVTCTPAADTFSALQRDRALLTGADLMLSASEMRHEAASGRLCEGWQDSCIPAHRTPCLRWGDDGERRLVEGMAREEAPAEAHLAALVMLALAQGPLDELEGFLPAGRVGEIVELLAERYPFFGIDEHTGLFCTIEPPASLLASAFGRTLDGCAAASVHGSRPALCEHLADALVLRGRAARAAEMAGAFLSKQDAACWLSRNGYRMLLAGSPEPFIALHERVRRRAGAVAEDLSAMRGWAWVVLGDAAQGAASVRRVALSATAPLRTRLVASLVGVIGGTAQGRVRMEATLRACLEEARSEPCPANEALALSGEGMDWPCLAELALALASDPASAIALWHGLLADAPSAAEAAAGRRNALLLGAAWALDEQASSDLGVLGPQGSVDGLARHIRDCAEHESALGALGWCAALAVSALERIAASDGRYAAYLPGPAALGRARRAEVELFSQREEVRRLLTGTSAPLPGEPPASRGSYGEQAAAPEAPVAADRQVSLPILKVKVFGSLQVHLGDVPLDRCELARSKARLLLALLVLNRGREVSRHRLAEMLWPTSRPRTAMKNFYSVWSQLRRALTIDGQCPYLVRSQEGCRLDSRLVVTDLAGFQNLLRDLTLPRGKDDWVRMYDLVCNDYGEDLLPCDLDNDLVNSYRLSCHQQLIDALLAASQRLWHGGEDRGALWFAREAVRRDPRREDACIALMEMLRHLNQRPEALDAYFACRRSLSEDLGIDPSERLVALYRSIIESEQPLD